MAICTLVMSSSCAQCVDFSYRAYGDSFGAPCESPGGCEYVDSTEHWVEVVHRLAHAHEHDVGEGGRLRYRQHLVDNLSGGEIAVEALAACHAEAASHAASGLGADTECGPVSVGYVDGLYIAPSHSFKQVFHRAVDASRLGLGGGASYGVAPGECGACGLGQIGHIVD